MVAGRGDGEERQGGSVEDPSVPASQADAVHRDAEETRPGAASSELADEAATEQVRDLLAEHVPLSLIADLASPEGPPSEAILDDEGLPDDEWWERDRESVETSPAD